MPGVLRNNLITVLITETVLYWHSPLWSTFLKNKQKMFTLACLFLKTGSYTRGIFSGLFKTKLITKFLLWKRFFDFYSILLGYFLRSSKKAKTCTTTNMAGKLLRDYRKSNKVTIVHNLFHHFRTSMKFSTSFLWCKMSKIKNLKER